jgi:mevalonate kinase
MSYIPFPTTPDSATSEMSTNGFHDDVDKLHINGNGTSNGTRNGNTRKMDRKQSSPMAPAFMVSAPGKVIVFGEHAVVHGKVYTTPTLSRRGITSLLQCATLTLYRLQLLPRFP